MCSNAAREQRSFDTAFGTMSNEEKKKQQGVPVRLDDERHGVYAKISAQTGLPIIALVRMASDSFFREVKEHGRLPTQEVNLTEEVAA